MKAPFRHALHPFLTVISRTAAADPVCQTEDAVISFLRDRAARQANSFTLSLAPELYDILVRDNHFHDVFSRAGLRAWHVRRSRTVGFVFTSAVYFQHFKYARTLPELNEHIEDCIARRLDAFSGFYDGLSSEQLSGELKSILLKNGVSESGISIGPGTYAISGVTYCDHFRYCAAPEALARFADECFEHRCPTFAFYLPATTNDDSRLVISPILCRAGILSWSSEYCGDRWIIRDPVYASHFRRCETLNEVKDFVRSCAAELRSDFAFSYPESAQKLMVHFHDLLFNNGYWHGKESHNRKNRLICIEKAVYRHGFRIVRARANNTPGLLSPVERLLYAQAQGVVKAAREVCSSDFQLARYFHDYLCRTVSYREAPEGNPNDTAVGGIMIGLAECDGYADSYYLLCSLAGLDIAFQRGKSGPKSLETGHIWNVLKLGSAWRFVDVTWDDMNCVSLPGLWSYCYFNIGYADSPRHRFHPQLSVVPIAGQIDRDYYVYTAPPASGFEPGAYAKDPVAVIRRWYAEGRRIMHLMVDGSLSGDDVQALLTRSVPDAPGCRVFYSFNIPGYTLIDLGFHDG